MSLRDLFSNITCALFPPACLSCDNIIPSRAEEAFCEDCRKQLVFIEGSICPICGRTYPDSPSTGHLCGHCIEKPPYFSLARAAASYETLIEEAIHRFKYGRNPAFGVALASFLGTVDFPDMDWQAYDMIIPVPLHIRKLRQRGFNQSLVLARGLSKTHRLPVNFSLLKRRKLTLTQTGLDKKQREKNVKDAFCVRHPEKIEGRNIILVDDVYTTGATTSECAKVLIRAGAGHVAVIVLARVPVVH